MIVFIVDDDGLVVCVGWYYGGLGCWRYCFGISGEFKRNDMVMYVYGFVFVVLVRLFYYVFLFDF